MAGKALIPLIAGLGAAAVLLSRKKKKTASSGNGNIVLTGSVSGFEWRVRKSSRPGFADQYFGEVKGPGESDFMAAHKDGRSNPQEARNLALELIADSIGEEVDANIVLTGTAAGWEWRVRQVSQPGFAAQYFGEAKAPGQTSFVAAHSGGRRNPEEARNLALEFIAGGLG